MNERKVIDLIKTWHASLSILQGLQGKHKTTCLKFFSLHESEMTAIYVFHSLI